MAKKETIDITKTGPQGYKALQEANDLGLSPEYRAFKNDIETEYAPVSMFDARAHAKQYVKSPLADTNTPWGASIFDNDTADEEAFSKLGDIRANSQSGILKLGAGIGKGISLAGTTFLDGTLGLAYGIGSAIANRDVSRLWDNEISNSLKEWNDKMEEWLPNHRTEGEQNMSVLEKMGTMNFWADSFLKNLGFTVGAYYSGGVWTKGLKALGAVTTGMGAKITGSFLSAFNEGRTEATNNTSDWKQLQYSQLRDSYDSLRSEIFRDSSLTLDQKIYKLEQLDKSKAKEEQNIEDRSVKMGLTDLIGNTILLSLDNFYTYGRLYARGFKNARDKIGNNVRRSLNEITDDVAKREAIEEAGKGIRREGQKYIYDAVSGKKAVGRGLLTSAREGNEELAQQWIANTSGELQNYDSPDAYYKALLDPTAERQTKDFITSATQGFVDSYGDGSQWEQFVVGALTGLLGTPTFGSVQNSDANTWLGRGKKVGMSGGIFGEIGEVNRQNREGQEAVDYMNQYMDKLQEKERHFVQSQSFTNAMDGWAEEGNAFEYKNAEDNDDFAAISRFAKVGKLNDLKDIVKQDFENISDEELDHIARFTTEESNNSGWRNSDGSYMSESEEGLTTMRSELSKKRDKILSEIDRYEKSIENVRAIGNNSLNEDQINELAWLDWKVGRFDDRFKSIKEENAELFTSLSNGLLNFKDSLDEESSEGKKMLKSVNNMIDFISYLQGAKTSLDLAGRISANKKLMEAISNQDSFDLFADESGLSYSSYKTAMDNLRDAARIATAAKSFNERYRQFVEDPMQLIRNREDIATRQANISRVSNDISAREKVSNATVSDIVASAEAGEVALDDLSGLYSDEDNSFLENGVMTDKGKVEEAKKIVTTSNTIAGEGGILNELQAKGEADKQAVEDAKKLLEISKSKSNSEEELLNLSTEAFNDPQLLYDDDPSLKGLTQEDVFNALDNRLTNAKNVLEQAKATMADRKNQLNDIPDSANDGIVTASLGSEVVGHDATEKGVPVNEPKMEDLTEDYKEDKSPEKSDNPSLDNDTKEVLKAISDLYHAGASDSEIGHRVKEMEAYKRVISANPNSAADFQSYLQSLREVKKPEVKKDDSYNAKSEEEVVTPYIDSHDIEKESTEQSKKDPNEGELSKEYLYWKRTTTEYPIHRVKGDNTPYYVIASTVESNKYSPQQLKRMKAVYEYLKANKTYDIINNGELQKGEKITFFIDKSLNDKAGEIVILMKDSKGRVVGDIMSKNDAPFSRQVGLPEFVARVEKAYKEAGEPVTFDYDKEATKVDKNMVGFAPYLSEKEGNNTLNQINTETIIASDGTISNRVHPFKLGIALTSGTNARIAASAGRRKKQGRSELEQSIISPVQAKAGQPYLLLPTSSKSDRRAYLPVPILISPYNESMDNTTFGKAVDKVLEKLVTVTNSTAIDVKRDLQELLAIPEVHINILDDGNLKVTIKPTGADKQTTIFNGSQADPELVSKIKAGLRGQPIQVSRKYVNDTYGEDIDYNTMIGEIAYTNLPVGTTHTIGDWFTVVPLGSNGEMLKAESPKTTGQNPYKAAPPTITIDYNGMAITVNTSNYEVSDSTGKVYEGPKANLIKAEAWGFVTNQSTTKPFNTNWGWFDPVSKKFVDAPNKVEKTLGEEELKKDSGTTENATEIAKKKGLLGNPVRKALWEVLTPEQQLTIANKKGPKQAQWMDALERAFNADTKTFDEGRLKGTVDDMLTRKGLYRREASKYSSWNRDQELKWLKKALPNFSNSEHLEILNGLIDIAGEEGKAWGQFKQGVITLSNVAARGTTYHEAFHAVTHSLLSNDERGTLFEEARKQYGDLKLVALEENLAEDFRRYTQVEELPLLGGIIKVFRKLKHFIKNLFGKEPYLDAIFYRINRGDFGNRTIRNSSVVRNRRDPYDIQKAITKLREDYDKASALVGEIRSADPYVIDSRIKESGLSDVLFRYQQRNNGMYSIARISKDVYEEKMRALRDALNKSWNSELSDDIVRSNELLEEEEETHYRRVEQHYRDKMMYGNLSQEDKDYVQARKISISDYNKMSPLEKEILFRCRY